ncbi:hypothetical protein GOODEAATRI_003952 [Goodea atripinnis]|uniref:DH domain-containing protein n=1 Tax=Goodea atripinnis TaxID=208336 RepID=A0ABV0PB65_9TELE
MKGVLDDTRLNTLRLEGGTVLARIRKEEPCENENYRCCQGTTWDACLDDTDQRFSPSVVKILQDYCTEACKFSLDNFSTLNDMVLSLACPQQLQQWSSVWQKCQQTKRQLEGTLARALLSAQNSNTVNTESSSPTAKSYVVPPELPVANGCLHLPGAITSLSFEDSKSLSAEPFSRSPSGSISSPSRFTFPTDRENKLGQSSCTLDDTDSDCTIDSNISCHSEPVYSKATRLRKHPMKKIMKKTMSYELTPREGGHSDVSHIHGYTGVYIKGLEVTNNVSAEKKLLRPEVTSPALGRSRSMSTPSRTHNRHSEGDGKKQSSYIIDHYFPEMERLDLPQDLRGKRSIIFGNLEKLWDFHSQYFLKELEASAHSPLSISSCFLRHQLELGDKMDLASYLLKPIQRMSKYALLLKDLIKECSYSQEQELSDLRTAEEMVRFQLRHGNDLLAMDAIRGCDVSTPKLVSFLTVGNYLCCFTSVYYVQFMHLMCFLFLLLECRTRASIAVSSFEHCAAFKRPHSTISNSSSSSSSSQSSSSLLGSLNLHLYSSPSHPHQYPMGSVASFAQWPYDCIEEDELEQDIGSSQPSMSQWQRHVFILNV